MTAIRVEVTAEQIAAAGDHRMAWASPVEDAISALTGQEVSIDGGGPDGPCVATIDQGATTLVVDLPPDASAWLDARWEQPVNSADVLDELGEPFGFDLFLDDWLVALIPPVEWVTLTEASRALKTIKPQGLRTAAQNRRDGSASETALAARLGMRRFGRDWLIPRDRLDAEVARRKAAARALSLAVLACPVCGVEPGDPCNGEVHAAEASAPVLHP